MEPTRGLYEILTYWAVTYFDDLRLEVLGNK